MASLRHDLIAVGIPKMRGSLEIDSEEKERARIERWHRSLDRALPTNAVVRFDKRFAVETRTIGEDTAGGTGFPVHTITKRGSTPRRTVLYLHGGGYTAPLDPFHVRYAARLAAKLGLPTGLDPEVRTALVGDLLTLMQGARVDHTGFFRDLARELRGTGGGLGTPVRDRVLDLPAYDDWATRWRALGPDPDAMDAVNPAYVPRNHLLQAALDAADEGDLAPFERMLEVVTHPFTERPEWAEYALPDPAGGPFVTYCGT